MAVAAGLLGLKLVTLATGIQPGGGLIGYLAAPVWTVPLAWRRRAPLGVTAAVMSGMVAEAWVGGFHDSVVALAVLMFLPYSVAAHSPGLPRGLAALGLIVAATSWVSAVPGGQSVSTSLSNVALVVLPFVTGLAVRQQRLRAAALVDLTRQLAREREERARAAVAEERGRIARELHDEVAHAMSVIAVQADAAEGALGHDPRLVRPPLVAIRDTARAALTDMRRVLGGLRGDEAAEFAPSRGLADLAELLDQVRAAGPRVGLRVEGEPVPLPQALDLAAYRVLQEGLTNVRKHAAAEHVEVVIRYGAASLGVEVTDDGAGATGGAGTGHGLAGIRERVGLLGGEFVAGPRARGFALRVTLPLA